MFTRKKCRIAHRADSCDTAEGVFYHGGTSEDTNPSNSNKKKEKSSKKGLRMRRKVCIPRLRIHMCSLLYLMRKMRRSCGRLLSVRCSRREEDSSKLLLSEKQARSVSSSYSQSSYYPEAIAECIEFIKRSAETESSALLH